VKQSIPTGGVDRRPDHVPPKGLQVLVQEPFSDRFEVNIVMKGVVLESGSGFILTPVVTVDGQNIDL
jgi:hypothetical protein